VDPGRRREHVVVDDLRRGTRVRRDAGVLQRLRDGEELAGRLVPEFVLGLRDWRAAQLVDGRADRFDVGGLVCADGPEVVGDLHANRAVERREGVGVHQFLVAEGLQALPVEGVLQVLERQRVVQERHVGGNHRRVVPGRVRSVHCVRRVRLGVGGRAVTVARTAGEADRPDGGRRPQDAAA
jgi:hypothetical protein